MGRLAILPSGGYTLGLYDVADDVEVFSVDISVPYVDIVNNLFLREDRTYGYLTDQTQGTDCLGELLETVWQTVKSDPAWANSTDPTQQLGPYNLVPGLNWVPGDFVRSVQIEINTVGPAINEWFPQSNFAKFGYICTGYPLGFPVGIGGGVAGLQWINFPNQLFITNPGDSLSYSSVGVNVYLLPGCYGTITLNRAAFPGPILYGGTPWPNNTGYPWASV